MKTIYGFNFIAVVGLVIGTFVFLVNETNAQTGSHAGATTSPLTSLWYTPPDEITLIRELLEEGRTQEAVKASYDFLELLEQSRADNNVNKYFGLNALCASLTSNKNPDEAIEACDKAVRIFPDKWQAYNNRGTALFTKGEFRKAASDYRHALGLGEFEDNIKALLEHNVNLAEGNIPKG